MSEDGIVCPVCFRHCRLREGQTGFCRARRNEGGVSVSVSYGKAHALALDPM
jgi:pyruvate formate lyase activating enzyme